MTDLPFGELLLAEQIHDVWRPKRQELVDADRDEPLRVRIHRCYTALKRAELVEQEGDVGVDAALVLRWIALNALYGTWDDQAGMPVKDRVALDTFTSEICRVDADRRIHAALLKVTQDAKALLENSFVIERFWRNPEWDQVRPQRGRATGFRDDVIGGRTARALHALLIAVYFLRCQIVHGGATLGSSLNRPTVEPAARILNLLSGQLLAAVTEHGLEMQWGAICYPPVRPA